MMMDTQTPNRVMRQHIKAAMKWKLVEASDLHSLILQMLGFILCFRCFFGFKVLSQFYWSDELDHVFLRVNSYQTAQGIPVTADIVT